MREEQSWRCVLAIGKLRSAANRAEPLTRWLRRPDSSPALITAELRTVITEVGDALDGFSQIHAEVADTPEPHDGPGHGTVVLMLMPLADLYGDNGRHMRWWTICECSVAHLVSHMGGEAPFETVTPPESVTAITEACRDLPVVTWTGGDPA